MKKLHNTKRGQGVTERFRDLCLYLKGILQNASAPNEEDMVTAIMIAKKMNMFSSASLTASDLATRLRIGEQFDEFVGLHFPIFVQASYRLGTADAATYRKVVGRLPVRKSFRLVGGTHA